LARRWTVGDDPQRRNLRPGRRRLLPDGRWFERQADRRRRVRDPRWHLLPDLGDPVELRCPEGGEVIMAESNPNSEADVDSVVDVIIIGAGPVGENVADRVVQGGLTAAIVERELVGGECSYWACMPTKALLRDAAALRAARRLPAAGQAVSGALD